MAGLVGLGIVAHAFASGAVVGWAFARARVARRLEPLLWELRIVAPEAAAALERALWRAP